MFEVGFTEIILIMGLALLVLGPQRLPELARKVGRWTGKARAMARQFQMQLEQEVTIDEITRSDAERNIGGHKSSASQSTEPSVPPDFTDPPPHVAASEPPEFTDPPPHVASSEPPADKHTQQQ